MALAQHSDLRWCSGILWIETVVSQAENSSKTRERYRCIRYTYAIVHLWASKYYLYTVHTEGV